MSAPRDKALDLSGIRRRVDGQGGRRFWQSLEELQETPEFLAFLHREFPENASELQDPAGRRLVEAYGIRASTSCSTCHR